MFIPWVATFFYRTRIIASCTYMARMGIIYCNSEERGVDQANLLQLIMSRYLIEKSLFLPTHEESIRTIWMELFYQ